jgi:hypothetical protein
LVVLAEPAFGLAETGPGTGEVDPVVEFGGDGRRFFEGFDRFAGGQSRGRTCLTNSWPPSQTVTG